MGFLRKILREVVRVVIFIAIVLIIVVLVAALFTPQGFATAVFGYALWAYLIAAALIIALAYVIDKDTASATLIKVFGAIGKAAEDLTEGVGEVVSGVGRGISSFVSDNIIPIALAVGGYLLLRDNKGGDVRSRAVVNDSGLPKEISKKQEERYDIKEEQ